MVDEFWVKFWGVRGSTPTPGESTLRYGGETSCLEIRAGASRLLVDCGSGARNLGLGMCQQKTAGDFDLLLTHTHLDHICGLPFFWPAFDPNSAIRAWAGHFEDNAFTLPDIVSRIMSPPVFPLSAKTLKALSFNDFKAGEDLSFGKGLSVQTMRLNHPGGACGYRIEYGGKVICVITDHEHGNADIDAKLPAFVEGADVMVYDAMYTDAEYETYVGWGHSTWQKAVELAKAANVKVPVLFHHDPRRTDDQLDEIGREADKAYPGTLVAREGLVLTP